MCHGAGVQHGLRYISFNDDSGYAVAARSYIAALAARGVPISWHPMTDDRKEPLLDPLRNRQLFCDRVLVHTFPEHFPRFLEQERSKNPAARIWGYTVWETDRLPRHWPALINRMDGVIVPAESNRRVFAASGVTVPIEVVPHLSQFEGAGPAQSGCGSIHAHLAELTGRIVFYSINTWLARKGTDLLVRAFTEAFSSDDPVALVLKTTPFDLQRTYRDWKRGFRRTAIPTERLVERILQKKRRPPKVVLITERMPDECMHTLHSMADCYISLCRAEGWGLGAYEAAWLGKPVITTGCGGHLDFLPSHLTSHVAYRQTPVRVPGRNRSYTPDQRWAEPDIGHAVTLMRRFVNEPAEFRVKGLASAAFVQQRFSSERIVRALCEALQLDRDQAPTRKQMVHSRADS